MLGTLYPSVVIGRAIVASATSPIATLPRVDASINPKPIATSAITAHAASSNTGSGRKFVPIAPIDWRRMTGRVWNASANPTAGCSGWSSFRPTTKVHTTVAATPTSTTADHTCVSRRANTVRMRSGAATSAAATSATSAKPGPSPRMLTSTRPAMPARVDQVAVGLFGVSAREREQRRPQRDRRRDLGAVRVHRAAEVPDHRGDRYGDAGHRPRPPPAVERRRERARRGGPRTRWRSTRASRSCRGGRARRATAGP